MSDRYPVNEPEADVHVDHPKYGEMVLIGQVALDGIYPSGVWVAEDCDNVLHLVNECNFEDMYRR